MQKVPQLYLLGPAPPPPPSLVPSFLLIREPSRYRDVFCGRIQCQGGGDRPLLGTNAEILTTKFNHSDLVCRGTFFHLGDDVSDPATVAQGTACGPGKVSGTPCRPGGVF